MSEAREQHSRYAAIFALGTMFSRVLGLIRDLLTTALIPAAAFDAFVVAFRLPNMLREIIGEGAVNAAFVPVFSDRLEKGSRQEFQRLVAAALGAMIVVLAVLTVAGMLFIPELTRVVNLVDAFAGSSAVSPESVAYLTHLSLLAFPYLFFIGLAVFCTAPLFSLHHYSTPSWTPALLNVALIGACFAGRGLFSDPAYALIAGVWIGGVAQLAAQYTAFGRHAGVWRPRFDFRDPGVRRIFLLLVPVVIGQAAGEVNRLVDSFFAYGLGTGVVRALFLASRLVQLPLSIFGSATSVAILPTLSRAHARGARDEVRAVLLSGLRQSFFLTVPAMAGLMALARPVVELLFERGHFDAAATTITATAVVISGAGLLSFAWLKVCSTGFYAMGNTRTPVVFSSASMILNVLLILVLIGPLGYKGLALATTISYTVNAALLFAFLWRAVGPLYDGPFVSSLLRIASASLLMGGAAYVLHAQLAGALGHATLGARLAITLGPIAAGIAVYAGLCRAMKVEELDGFVQAFRRRLS